jgi:thioredoxin reductase (NADPH)
LKSKCRRNFTENGFIRQGLKSIVTNVSGGAGDCSDHICRQAITLAGAGCAVAIDAERFLAAENQ